MQVKDVYDLLIRPILIGDTKEATLLEDARHALMLYCRDEIDPVTDPFIAWTRDIEIASENPLDPGYISPADKTKILEDNKVRAFRLLDILYSAPAMKSLFIDKLPDIELFNMPDIRKEPRIKTFTDFYDDLDTRNYEFSFDQLLIELEKQYIRTSLSKVLRDHLLSSLKSLKLAAMIVIILLARIHRAQ